MIEAQQREAGIPASIVLLDRVVVEILRSWLGGNMWQWDISSLDRRIGLCHVVWAAGNAPHPV